MLIRILKTWALLMLITVAVLGGLAGLFSLVMFLNRIDTSFAIGIAGALLLLAASIILEV